MTIINVEALRKVYKIHQKEPGIMGSIKSFLFREYEEKEAIDDISFTVNEGDFIGFIGPNGAGKTTTIKILSGLLYPSGGNVSVLGYIPWKREVEYRKQISLLMGNKSQLIWDLPPMEYFRLIKEIYEIPSMDFNKRVKQLAEDLNVAHLLNIQTRALSLGERMKMEIIASVIYYPPILFLDEPTIGLDLFAQKTIREFLKDYNRKYGATILLTSHYLNDIEELCDKLLIMSNGRIVYDGQMRVLVDKFSVYKYIKIVFNENVPEDFLKSLGTISFQEDQKVILRTDKEKATEVASMILDQHLVEDLTIENLSLEDVVINIYEQ